VIAHAHVETRSLDDLFPNLHCSAQFSTSLAFRTALRSAMRADMLDTTVTYHGLSEHARQILLLPDSSLQGSWQCCGTGGGDRWARRAAGSSNDNDETNGQQQQQLPRMIRLTQVLKDYLGSNAPTGDEFMDTIGSLCGPAPTTHWMDIVGVVNRRVQHSWHQDTGRSEGNNAKTVLLGFPPTDNYDGVGVFSHIIRLQHEQWAVADHPLYQPVLYNDVAALDDVGDEYIMRPRFAPGRELILYRDVDVLHSSPDVAYRTSVMRFM
jgi:hypothetical protein